VTLAQGSGRLGAEQYSFFGGFDDAASDALGGLEVSDARDSYESQPGLAKR